MTTYTKGWFYPPTRVLTSTSDFRLFVDAPARVPVYRVPITSIRHISKWQQNAGTFFWAQVPGVIDPIPSGVATR
jgi:hypothetical protein